MPQSQDQIISDVQKYVNHCGGQYPSWFLGVTDNPKDKLFNEHCVDMKKDHWLFAFAMNPDSAKQILARFKELGAEVNDNALSPRARAVYAFKKSWRTNPVDNEGSSYLGGKVWNMDVDDARHPLPSVR
jgi:hypothetical protein